MRDKRRVCKQWFTLKELINTTTTTIIIIIIITYAEAETQQEQPPVTTAAATMRSSSGSAMCSSALEYYAWLSGGARLSRARLCPIAAAALGACSRCGGQHCGDPLCNNAFWGKCEFPNYANGRRAVLAAFAALAKRRGGLV